MRYGSTAVQSECNKMKIILFAGAALAYSKTAFHFANGKRTTANINILYNVIVKALYYFSIAIFEKILVKP